MKMICYFILMSMYLTIAIFAMVDAWHNVWDIRTYALSATAQLLDWRVVDPVLFIAGSYGLGHATVRIFQIDEEREY